MTPFVLAYLHRESGGRTLRANRDLIAQNARLAGEIAVAAVRSSSPLPRNANAAAHVCGELRIPRCAVPRNGSYCPWPVDVDLARSAELRALREVVRQPVASSAGSGANEAVLRRRSRRSSCRRWITRYFVGCGVGARRQPREERRVVGAVLAADRAVGREAAEAAGDVLSGDGEQSTMPRFGPSTP